MIFLLQILCPLRVVMPVFDSFTSEIGHARQKLKSGIPALLLIQLVDTSVSQGKEMMRGHAIAVTGQLWPAVVGLGGDSGWLFGHWLWRLRGLLDKWCGGVGLDRGRRADANLRVGNALDFWRVIELPPPRRLTLLAELLRPG
jgi:hypothetical protein